MKILLYSRVFPPAVGGMERFAETLALWLTTAGHDVTVATRTPLAASPDVHRPYRVLRSPTAWQLYRAVRAADVVHVNGLSARGIAAALTGGRRPIVTHQGHQAVCPTGLAWGQNGFCNAGPRPGPCEYCPARGRVAAVRVDARRAGVQAAAWNVCVSHYLRRRLSPPRSATIYNPVLEPAAFDSRRDRGEFVVFVGRLVSEKGLDLLIRSIARVAQVRLEVAGDGPMRTRWGELARELGVANRVRFLGALARGDVLQLCARADVVCVPSIWQEPFGYAAAEAMAAGVPVVSTPSGALPELLARGRGFVAEECTPEALAGALSRALSDGASRLRVISEARNFVRRELSVDAIGPQYVRCYHDGGS